MNKSESAMNKDVHSDQRSLYIKIRSSRYRQDTVKVPLIYRQDTVKIPSRYRQGSLISNLFMELTLINLPSKFTIQ